MSVRGRRPKWCRRTGFTEAAIDRRLPAGFSITRRDATLAATVSASTRRMRPVEKPWSINAIDPRVSTRTGATDSGQHKRPASAVPDVRTRDFYSAEAHR